MKRAPVIPKHTLNTQPVEDTSLSTPAAPMVDSLIARVGVMARGVIVLRRPLGYGQVMNVTRSCLLRTHWMISSLLFY